MLRSTLRLSFIYARGKDRALSFLFHLPSISFDQSTATSNNNRVVFLILFNLLWACHDDRASIQRKVVSQGRSFSDGNLWPSAHFALDWERQCKSTASVTTIVIEARRINNTATRTRTRTNTKNASSNQQVTFCVRSNVHVWSAILSLEVFSTKNKWQRCGSGISAIATALCPEC